MKKIIVTTTIQPPTDATMKFSNMNGWEFIIVGDLKTPHSEYKKGNWIYLTPEYQRDTYPELSEAIGWNCIMRRNIGFLEAYKRGADVVASIDDDNIPYPTWGDDILVGQTIEVDLYSSDCGVLDPMKLTNHPELWHRGFPIDRLYESKINRSWFARANKKVLFQACLWDGDPDVDALCRLMYKPTNLKLFINKPFSSPDYIPFNSQNTFIAREALPYYMVLPHVGRSDDIWGGYIAQFLLNTRPVFTKPTVFQKRNEQYIYKNLEDELFGYRYTSKLLNSMSDYVSLLPQNTLLALDLYRDSYYE